MATPWNLSTEGWSNVLLDGTKPKALASKLTQGNLVPWTDILLKFSETGDRILDLGSGRGEHSAILARHGRKTTLLDWSTDNLRFSAQLFKAMGIPGSFCQADITKPLPFQRDSFDVVFSCGVFEYFSSAQIDSILQEAFKISAKRIIIMVPNAFSLAYQIGRWYMEKHAKWPWGGEVPSYSLKRHFRALGGMRILEFSVGAKHSLQFLTMPGGKRIGNACCKLLRLKESSRPSLFRQGYLLITIGEKLELGRGVGYRELTESAVRKGLV